MLVVGAGGLLAPLQHARQGALGCARVIALGIAEAAGVVDFIAAEAEVGGGWREKVVVILNDFRRPSGALSDFLPMLRGVVFIGGDDKGPRCRGPVAWLRGARVVPSSGSQPLGGGFPAPSIRSVRLALADIALK